MTTSQTNQHKRARNALRLSIALVVASNNFAVSHVHASPASDVAISKTVVQSHGLSPSQAKAKAVYFLPRKDVKLIHRGFQSWGTMEGKGLKCYHFEGPRDESISINVDSTSGEVIVYDWIGLQSRSQRAVLNKKQAQLKVEQFLKEKTHFLSDPNIRQKRAELLDHGDAGKEYSFEWKKVINDVEYPFDLSVNVSAQTGDIVGFQVVEDKITLSALSPIISKEQVVALANPKVTLQPGYSIQANLFVTSHLIGQKLMWRVIAKGTNVLPYDPERGQIAYDAFTQFKVDATTGKIESQQTFHEEPRHIVQLKPPASPATYTSVDFLPLLSANTLRPLFFLSSRNSDGYSSILGSARAKQLSNLFTAPGRLTSYDWSEPAGRLAFGMSDTIYVLDLKSGTMGQCNDSERARRTMPSWDNTGHWLAMSGTHSPSDHVGSDDSDVFVGRITDELSRVSARDWRCLAVLPGEDILPVYSSDGKQIVFAHQDVSKGADGTYQPVAGETWSLYLVGTAKTKEPDEYPAPHKILGGLTRPERLSWFPDGKRLLVSFIGNDYKMKNPPQIVDVDKGTASEWKLPALHDPDLTRAKPLVVRELSVSPDGKRVAFRALRWTGDQKDAGAVCIYSCDVDGSNVALLTPPTTEPLQPLAYPVAGVTALNAWVKLEPKRNLGTPVTPQ